VRIEVGRHAGFCRGVKAAVDGAFECARQADGEIFTDGELIHNTQTLQLLERHDVRILERGGEPVLLVIELPSKQVGAAGLSGWCGCLVHGSSRGHGSAKGRWGLTGLQ